MKIPYVAPSIDEIQVDLQIQLWQGSQWRGNSGNAPGHNIGDDNTPPGHNKHDWEHDAFE